MKCRMLGSWLLTKPYRLKPRESRPGKFVSLAAQRSDLEVHEDEVSQ